MKRNLTVVSASGKASAKSDEEEARASSHVEDRGESSDGSVFSTNEGEPIFRTSFVTISQYR